MGAAECKCSKRKVTCEMLEDVKPMILVYRQNNNNAWLERKEIVATKLKRSHKQALEKEVVFGTIVLDPERPLYDLIDEENINDQFRERPAELEKCQVPVTGQLRSQPPLLAECRQQTAHTILECDDTYYEKNRIEKFQAPITGRPLPQPPSLQLAECLQQTSHNKLECDEDHLDPDATLLSLPPTIDSGLQTSNTDNTVRKMPAVSNFQQHSIANTSRKSRLEDEEKCAVYKEMVNIFKPMIVQNILVQDILPLLPFLDNHDDIYAEMMRRSEKSAVVMLLDELERSKEIGKWDKFIDALKACGYSFIVDNIRGYKFINHHYQKEYLKQMTPVIAKKISPPVLMPFLMSYDLLGDTDKDYILCECNNHGDSAGALLLLDRITKRHRNWYNLFIKALDDAKYEDVAENLRIEKLMENGRIKDKDDETKDSTSCIPPGLPFTKTGIRSNPSTVIEDIDDAKGDTGIYQEIRDPKPIKDNKIVPIPHSVIRPIVAKINGENRHTNIRRETRDSRPTKYNIIVPISPSVNKLINSKINDVNDDTSTRQETTDPLPIKDTNERIATIAPTMIEENDEKINAAKGDNRIHHKTNVTTPRKNKTIVPISPFVIEKNCEEIVTDDKVVSEEPIKQPKHTNPKFIQQEEEINKLALEEKELRIEADIIERQFAHCKNIVEIKKKMRQQQNQIKDMKQEISALNEEAKIGNESHDSGIHEEYSETENLYPGDTRHQVITNSEHGDTTETKKTELSTFDQEFLVDDFYSEP